MLFAYLDQFLHPDRPPGPCLLVPADHSDRSDDAVALAFLRARPGDIAFRQALALADEMAEEAKQFWMNR